MEQLQDHGGGVGADAGQGILNVLVAAVLAVVVLVILIQRRRKRVE